jgi:hypothetical protein
MAKSAKNAISKLDDTYVTKGTYNRHQHIYDKVESITGTASNHFHTIGTNPTKTKTPS